METFPVNFYNIHNLLEMRVENLDLRKALSHFLTNEVSRTVDLKITVGKFDPKPTHSDLGRFHLGHDTIFEKRLFGSVQLSDMLGETELNATKGYVKLRPFFCLIENILKLKLLTKNHSLIHSSCISDDGKGYIICGWMGTGKTMVTLKFIKERGLKFLSDDLTIISDSGQAYCFPKDVELRFAHTKKFKLRKKVKLKLQLGELVKKLGIHYLVPYSVGHKTSITEIAEDSTIEEQCKIYKVITLQQSQSERIAEIDSGEIVRRLMLLEEYALTFWVNRLLLPYAYCDPKFDLQKLRKKQQEILRRTLKGIPCYEVRFRKFPYNLVKKLVAD